MSGVHVLDRRFRLASNRYIVYENVSVKVCQYEVMMSYGLFEKTNEHQIFSKNLRILTGKNHHQIKLQHSQKVGIWAFGPLVHQFNSL